MKIKILLIILFGIFMTQLSYSQHVNILEKIISENADSLFPVVQNKDKFEVQILYTQINKDKDDKINLTTYSFNENPQKYFYPASTVKFPAAVLSLEKLNDLKMKGLNKYTHFSIDSLYEGLTSFDKDFKTECGYPNIAEFIKRVFLVSDNQAFNRLFDFLGQKELNDRLRKKGFNNTRILHRLEVARTADQNRQTNPIKFYDEEGNIIYEQPAKFDSTDVNLNLSDTKKGKGYYSNGELINEPKDFSANNFFGLRDQHNLLIRIFYPELFKESERFNLIEDDYKFLRNYMSMLPKESVCPKYSNEEYWDSYVKFFIFGDSKNTMPENIKIYNKVGDAYGFMLDNAYIVDEGNDVKFFLSAVIHVNENQIYNDDTYEYDTIALPFLSKLGKVIYDYEKGRK
ncbi:MAG: serine hydrolase [Ignavibacteriales bacterium]|nr:serine hydrolase [Ignavibacteriales bacterium]